jgi:choline dehydrogenase-like flavoprotein
MFQQLHQKQNDDYMITDIHNIAESSLKTSVVIIGSGAAGAILAYKLAMNGIDCIVLEEGKQYSRKDLAMSPLKVAQEIYRDCGFFSTLGKPIMPIPVGKALGGTTVVNSGTCFQTPHAKIKKWQNELGLNTLTIDKFEASFEFLKELVGMEYAKEAVISSGNLKFAEGLKEMGLKAKPLLRNTKNCNGSGFCCYGCPTGAKQSMDVSVIPKASAAGATFIVEAKAEKIKRKGNKVDYILAVSPKEEGRPQKKLKVFANAYVISAGAIHSPALLLKNNIRLKQIGNHLTIHPTTKVLAEFDEPIHAWKGIPQALECDALKKEGITFEGVFLPPDMVGAALPYHLKYADIMQNYDKIGGFGALIHDSHYGKVRHYPLIGTKAFYSLTNEDVNKFKKAIAFMARVYLKSGAKKVYPFVNHEMNCLENEADIEAFMQAKIRNQDIESMGFHPLGTLRMGTNKKESVVDKNCLIHNMENLYACDGSVVPTMLGVNPQVTIMNFANLLGDHLSSFLDPSYT